MRKIVFNTLVLFAAAIILAPAWAQDAPEPQIQVKAAETSLPLNFSLGISYRNFHSISFKGAAMPAYHGVYSALEGSEGIGSYADKVNNYLWPIGGAVALNAYSVTSAGYAFSGNGDTGLQESLAPILGVEMPFYREGRITLSAVANLQFFDFDTAARMPGKAIAQEYRETFSLIAPIGGTPGTDYYLPSGIWPNSKVDSNYLSASSKSKFDMQLYVLDFGVKMAYGFDCGLEANLALGPSLSLADMESSSYSVLRSPAGNVLNNRKARDNDLEYVFGAYVSVGASYWLDERYGVAFDIRYDEAFNHTNTQLADLDLDSWSGVLKFIFRF